MISSALTVVLDGCARNTMYVILCAKVIKAITQNKPPTKPPVETLGSR